jgi:phosphoribosyl-AMP cyclohydrolase
VNTFSEIIDGPDFSRGSEGLLPAIAQDVHSHQVLMLAWMNREAYEETQRTGQATYYSRSRARLWRKGEESGHRQKVVEVRIDCDADTILLLVEQQGAACHEGYASCFFRSCSEIGVVENQPRLIDPKTVYPTS